MEFNCEKCHYFTKVKCNFAKHMASKRQSLDMQLPYICKCFICGRKYKSKSGLWRHQINHKPITELLQTRIEKEIVENSELLQPRIEKEIVEKSELLQTRIDKEPVENSELLQTRIEKEPGKLVENTIVKTSTDPSTEQKRKKKNKTNKTNKTKINKRPRKNFACNPTAGQRKIWQKQICTIKLQIGWTKNAKTMPVRQCKGCDHV